MYKRDRFLCTLKEACSFHTRTIERCVILWDFNMKLDHKYNHITILFITRHYVFLYLIPSFIILFNKSLLIKQLYKNNIRMYAKTAIHLQRHFRALSFFHFIAAIVEGCDFVVMLFKQTISILSE